MFYAIPLAILFLLACVAIGHAYTQRDSNDHEK